MTEPTLEQKVLGIAFASPRDLQDLTAARVRPEHFQQPVNRGIWEIIQTQESKQQPQMPQALPGPLQTTCQVL